MGDFVQPKWEYSLNRRLDERSYGNEGGKDLFKKSSRIFLLSQREQECGSFYIFKG